MSKKFKKGEEESVARLVEDVRKSQKFKVKARYSLQCLAKVITPPRVGWENKARQAAQAGSVMAMAELAARFASDAELFKTAMEGLYSTATLPRLGGQMVAMGFLEPVMKAIKGYFDAAIESGEQAAEIEDAMRPAFALLTLAAKVDASALVAGHGVKAMLTLAARAAGLDPETGERVMAAGAAGSIRLPGVATRACALLDALSRTKAGQEDLVGASQDDEDEDGEAGAAAGEGGASASASAVPVLLAIATTTLTGEAEALSPGSPSPSRRRRKTALSRRSRRSGLATLAQGDRAASQWIDPNSGVCHLDPALRALDRLSRTDDGLEAIQSADSGQAVVQRLSVVLPVVESRPTLEAVCVRLLGRLLVGGLPALVRSVEGGVEGESPAQRTLSARLLAALVRDVEYVEQLASDRLIGRIIAVCANCAEAGTESDFAVFALQTLHRVAERSSEMVAELLEGGAAAAVAAVCAAHIHDADIASEALALLAELVDCEEAADELCDTRVEASEEVDRSKWEGAAEEEDCDTGSLGVHDLALASFLCHEDHEGTAVAALALIQQLRVHEVDLAPAYAGCALRLAVSAMQEHPLSLDVQLAATEALSCLLSSAELARLAVEAGAIPAINDNLLHRRSSAAALAAAAAEAEEEGGAAEGDGAARALSEDPAASDEEAEEALVVASLYALTSLLQVEEHRQAAREAGCIRAVLAGFTRHPTSTAVYTAFREVIAGLEIRPQEVLSAIGGVTRYTNVLKAGWVRLGSSGEDFRHVMDAVEQLGGLAEPDELLGEDENAEAEAARAADIGMSTAAERLLTSLRLLEAVTVSPRLVAVLLRARGIAALAHALGVLAAVRTLKPASKGKSGARATAARRKLQGAAAMIAAGATAQRGSALKRVNAGRGRARKAGGGGGRAGAKAAAGGDEDDRAPRAEDGKAGIALALQAEALLRACNTLSNTARIAVEAESFKASAPPADTAEADLEALGSIGHSASRLVFSREVAETLARSLSAKPSLPQFASGSVQLIRWLSYSHDSHKRRDRVDQVVAVGIVESLTAVLQAAKSDLSVSTEIADALRRLAGAGKGAVAVATRGASRVLIRLLPDVAVGGTRRHQVLLLACLNVLRVCASAAESSSILVKQGLVDAAVATEAALASTTLSQQHSSQPAAAAGGAAGAAAGGDAGSSERMDPAVTAEIVAVIEDLLSRLVTAADIAATVRSLVELAEAAEAAAASYKGPAAGSAGGGKRKKKAASTMRWEAFAEGELAGACRKFGLLANTPKGRACGRDVLEAGGNACAKVAGAAIRVAGISGGSQTEAGTPERELEVSLPLSVRAVEQTYRGLRPAEAVITVFGVDGEAMPEEEEEGDEEGAAADEAAAAAAGAGGDEEAAEEARQLARARRLAGRRPGGCLAVDAVPVLLEALETVPSVSATVTRCLATLAVSEHHAAGRLAHALQGRGVGLLADALKRAVERGDEAVVRSALEALAGAADVDGAVALVVLTGAAQDTLQLLGDLAQEARPETLAAGVLLLARLCADDSVLADITTRGIFGFVRAAVQRCCADIYNPNEPLLTAAAMLLPGLLRSYAVVGETWQGNEHPEGERASDSRAALVRITRLGAASTGYLDQARCMVAVLSMVAAAATAEGGVTEVVADANREALNAAEAALTVRHALVSSSATPEVLRAGRRAMAALGLDDPIAGQYMDQIRAATGELSALLAAYEARVRDRRGASSMLAPLHSSDEVAAQLAVLKDALRNLSAVIVAAGDERLRGASVRDAFQLCDLVVDTVAGLQPRRDASAQSTGAGESGKASADGGRTFELRADVIAIAVQTMGRLTTISSSLFDAQLAAYYAGTAESWELPEEDDASPDAVVASAHTVLRMGLVEVRVVESACRCVDAVLQSTRKAAALAATAQQRVPATLQRLLRLVARLDRRLRLSAGDVGHLDSAQMSRISGVLRSTLLRCSSCAEALLRGGANEEELAELFASPANLASHLVCAATASGAGLPASSTAAGQGDEDAAPEAAEEGGGAGASGAAVGAFGEVPTSGTRLADLVRAIAEQANGAEALWQVLGSLTASIHPAIALTHGRSKPPADDADHEAVEAAKAAEADALAVACDGDVVGTAVQLEASAFVADPELALAREEGTPEGLVARLAVARVLLTVLAEQSLETAGVSPEDAAEALAGAEGVTPAIAGSLLAACPKGGADVPAVAPGSSGTAQLFALLRKAEDAVYGPGRRWGRQQALRDEELDARHDDEDDEEAAAAAAAGGGAAEDEAAAAAAARAAASSRARKRWFKALTRVRGMVAAGKSASSGGLTAAALLRRAAEEELEAQQGSASASEAERAVASALRSACRGHAAAVRDLALRFVAHMPPSALAAAADDSNDVLGAALVADSMVDLLLATPSQHVVASSDASQAADAEGAGDEAEEEAKAAAAAEAAQAAAAATLLHASGGVPAEALRVVGRVANLGRFRDASLEEGEGGKALSARRERLAQAGVFRAATMAVHRLATEGQTEAVELALELVRSAMELAGEAGAAVPVHLLRLNRQSLLSVQQVVRRLGPSSPTVAAAGGALIDALCEVYAEQSGTGYADRLSRLLAIAAGARGCSRSAEPRFDAALSRGLQLSGASPDGSAFPAVHETSTGLAPPVQWGPYSYKDASGTASAACPAGLEAFLESAFGLDEMTRVLEDEAVTVVPAADIAGVVQVLNEHANDPGVAGVLIAALARLAGNGGNTDAILAAGAVPGAVAAVRRFWFDPRVCESLAELLLPLSFVPEHTQHVTGGGITGLLVDMFRRFRGYRTRATGSPLAWPPAGKEAENSKRRKVTGPGAAEKNRKDPRITKAAIQTLANVACENLPVSDEPGAPTAVQSMVQAGGVAALGAVMDEQLANPRLLEDAMCLLSNIAYTGDDVQLEIGRRCIDTVVRVTRAYHADAHLFRMALRAIGNLTRCDENIMRVVGHGVISGIVQGMAAHSSKEDVLHLSADVVGNLASVDERVVPRAAGVEILKECHRARLEWELADAARPDSILRRANQASPGRAAAEASRAAASKRSSRRLGKKQSADEAALARVQEAGIDEAKEEAFLETIEEAPTLKEAVCECLYADKGPTALLRAVECFSTRPGLVTACLRALHYVGASHSLIERLIKKENMLRRVLHGMRSCDFDPELLRRGARVLGAALEVDTVRSAVLAAGVPHVLLSAVDTHRDHAPLCITCLSVLMLGQGPLVHQAARELNSVETLAGMIRDNQKEREYITIILSILNGWATQTDLAKQVSTATLPTCAEMLRQFRSDPDMTAAVLQFVATLANRPQNASATLAGGFPKGIVALVRDRVSNEASDPIAPGDFSAAVWRTATLQALALVKEMVQHCTRDTIGVLAHIGVLAALKRIGDVHKELSTKAGVFFDREVCTLAGEVLKQAAAAMQDGAAAGEATTLDLDTVDLSEFQKKPDDLSAVTGGDDEDDDEVDFDAEPDETGLKSAISIVSVPLEGVAAAGRRRLLQMGMEATVWVDGAPKARLLKLEPSGQLVLGPASKHAKSKKKVDVFRVRMSSLLEVRNGLPPSYRRRMLGRSARNANSTYAVESQGGALKQTWHFECDTQGERDLLFETLSALMRAAA